jgi:hypothetical protein
MALHPVDTVKTIQQLDGATMAGAARSIVKKSGPLGLYAGVGPYVTLDALSGCVKFAAYEACNRWAQANLREDQLPAARFVSAGIAFMACSVVLVPGELLKLQLQSSVCFFVFHVVDTGATGARVDRFSTWDFSL